MNASVAVILCAAAATLCGCLSSSLDRGAEFYRGGQYIDADAVFEHAEGRIPSYDVTDRARYGLYRGATLLALGDRAAAQRWLAYGARNGNSELSTDERALLIESMSALRAAASPAATPTGVPTATSDWIRASFTPSGEADASDGSTRPAASTLKRSR